MESTRRAVEQLIGFALEQLGAKNRHHEFEHVCRKFARQRICAHILPTTGPVSSGGDHGRDFETYVTHLRDKLDAKTWFVGHSTEGAVAFACSLQRENVKRYTGWAKPSSSRQVQSTPLRAAESCVVNASAESLTSTIETPHDLPILVWHTTGCVVFGSESTRDKPAIFMQPVSSSCHRCGERIA